LVVLGGWDRLWRRVETILPVGRKDSFWGRRRLQEGRKGGREGRQRGRRGRRVYRKLPSGLMVADGSGDAWESGNQIRHHAGKAMRTR
jgi:hypothetical protein